MPRPAHAHSSACARSRAITPCRHSTASLVSRQLRRACLAPALLRDLDIDMSCSWHEDVLEALCRWLHRHRVALHARSACLALPIPGHPDDDSPYAQQDAYAAQTACLAALAVPPGAAVGSGLQTLELDGAESCSLHAVGWPAALTSLTRLALRCDDGRICLGAAMADLRSLQQLSLSARYVELSNPWSSGALPPALTALTYIESEGDALPPMASGAAASLRRGRPAANNPHPVCSRSALPCLLPARRS